MEKAILEIKVRGMICRACEDAVDDALMHTRGVINAEASYRRSVVKVEYDPEIVSQPQLEKAIEDGGYEVGEGGVSGVVVDVISLVAVAALVWFFRNVTLINVPKAEAGASLGYLFLIGLLTSTHCIGMCGGILLSQTTSTELDRTKRGALASVAYNGGRVVSYTLIGGVFGAIGAVITYTMTAKSIVFTMAGAIVALMGLVMSGAVPFLRGLSPVLPGACSLPRSAKKRFPGKPLVIGLLTGLMPCGALYAMWTVAMSSGSFWGGAASMLAFSLGTVPLLVLFGSINSFIPKKWMKYMIRVSAVLVVALGIKMLINGLVMAAAL